MFSIRPKFPKFSKRRHRALSIQQKSLIEWNASDRFPVFEVTCSATRGMLGETLLLKMADVLNIFAALEQDDLETISCIIFYNNDDVILLVAVACFMWGELTRVNGYFEVTIPAYLSNHLENHFRMTRETCQLLTQ